MSLNLRGKGTGGVRVTGTMYATGNIGLDSTDYIAWTNNTQMDFYVNGANDMRLESDGDLHVEGDVVAFSTTIASDPRLKENVEQVTDAVAKVEQLTGYTFDYKHGGASAGVMSTDVAQVLPSAVTQTTLPFEDRRRRNRVRCSRLRSASRSSYRSCKRTVGTGKGVGKWR